MATINHWFVWVLMHLLVLGAIGSTVDALGRAVFRLFPVGWAARHPRWMYAFKIVGYACVNVVSIVRTAYAWWMRLPKGEISVTEAVEEIAETLAKNPDLVAKIVGALPKLGLHVTVATPGVPVPVAPNGT